jgi:hypothetical protein
VHPSYAEAGCKLKLLSNKALFIEKECIVLEDARYRGRVVGHGDPK